MQNIQVIEKINVKYDCESEKYLIEKEGKLEEYGWFCWEGKYSKGSLHLMRGGYMYCDIKNAKFLTDNGKWDKPSGEWPFASCFEDYTNEKLGFRVRTKDLNKVWDYLKYSVYCRQYKKYEEFIKKSRADNQHYLVDNEDRLWLVENLDELMEEYKELNKLLTFYLGKPWIEFPVNS